METVCDVCGNLKADDDQRLQHYSVVQAAHSGCAYCRFLLSLIRHFVSDTQLALVKDLRFEVEQDADSKTLIWIFALPVGPENPVHDDNVEIIYYNFFVGKDTTEDVLLAFLELMAPSGTYLLNKDTFVPGFRN